MSARRPARLLAPLALVITAVALIAVITSGGGSSTSDEIDLPAATATPTAAADSGKSGRKRKTYTVKPGDTPSAIAAEHDITVDRLLELNPDVDPQGLTPGQKLKLAP